MVISDLAVGIAIPVIAAILYKKGYLGGREILLLIWGVLLGSAFEVFIGLQGSEFLSVKLDWPLPHFTLLMCHSVWDGGLFMAGVFLAHFILRKPIRQIATSFDWRELSIMVAWGAVSAFVVELIGNGNIWEYHPQDWNPVWIRVGEQGYTAFIQIVWLVVPLVFYLGALAISRKMAR